MWFTLTKGPLHYIPSIDKYFKLIAVSLHVRVYSWRGFDAVALPRYKISTRFLFYVDEFRAQPAPHPSWTNHPSSFRCPFPTEVLWDMRICRVILTTCHGRERRGGLCRRSPPDARVSCLDLVFCQTVHMHGALYTWLRIEATHSHVTRFPTPVRGIAIDPRAPLERAPNTKQRPRTAKAGSTNGHSPRKILITKSEQRAASAERSERSGNQQPSNPNPASSTRTTRTTATDAESRVTRL